MPNKLTKLRVNRVDLVDQPAVPKAKFLILKSDVPVETERITKAAVVLPFRDLPVSDERSWDANAAEASVRAWAGGDDMDWGKYSRAFLVRDGDTKNLTSYKYPIATIKDGKLTAVWGGLVAALQRGRQQLAGTTGTRFENHIKRYYKKLKQEFPAKKEKRFGKMNHEEIKGKYKISDEDFQSFLDSLDPDENVKRVVQSEVKTTIQPLFDAFKEQLRAELASEESEETQDETEEPTVEVAAEDIHELATLAAEGLVPEADLKQIQTLFQGGTRV